MARGQRKNFIRDAVDKGEFSEPVIENNRATMHFMHHAIAEAKKALALDEVPIGAVVVKNGVVLASAHNLIETRKDVAAHAEILALQRAAQQLGDWRLEECDVYVTLEPCPMCAHAISNARIRRLYFGAYNPKGGGVEHGARLFHQPTCTHKPDIFGGILAAETGALLTDFFTGVRT